MHRFRRERNEIPECVVRSCRLRKAAIGLHLDGMDEVGEFNGILDEENRDVIADQVPVAVLCVKLDGKSAYVTRGIHRTRTACDGRYTSEHGCLLAYPVSYTHLRAHETKANLVCRLLLEKKKTNKTQTPTTTKTAQPKTKKTIKTTKT